VAFREVSYFSEKIDKWMYRFWTISTFR